MRLRSVLITLFAGWLLGPATPAAAQNNSEVLSGIQFDFSLPGARSLGLGGAFVALADDATAAWANPAGLTILTRKEASAELRSWRFKNFITDRGHAFGTASGIGADTVTGLFNSESVDSTVSPAFLSFVFPFGRWSFAAYRHQVSNFEAHISSTGPFLDSGGDIDRVDPFVGNMKLEIADYGGSFGYRLTSRVSVGIGVGLHDFSMQSTTDRFLYLPLGPPPVAQRASFTGVGQRFGPADLSASNALFTLTQVGSDQAVAVNIGGLYRGERVSVGAAFRQGPEFKYSTKDVAGPASPRAGGFAVGQVVDEENGIFAVPDVYAVGVAFHSPGALQLSIEYDRVEYSQLSKQNVEVLGIEESNPVLGPTIGKLITENLTFPDSNQLRAGAEYFWARPTNTILFRLGAWLDPDHRLRFESDDPLVLRLPVLYRPGSNNVHLAPGAGIAFRSFQIDAAVDISKQIRTVAVSTVYRF